MIKTQKKPKIMILGMFHMRYTPDLQRMEFDDLLADQRQEEIAKVVEHIKEFEPTKVAFEVVKSQEEKLNLEYKQHLNGELTLSIDEVHQLGFRIARDLKHKRVYAIDWMETVGNRGLGEVFDWAKKEQLELYDYINQKYRSQFQINIENDSIYDVIKRQNQEFFILNQHEMYMAVARIGTEEDYVGIDWIRWWYQRNLIIYHNLAKITTAPTDRTLLIIGAAHVHLISQFLKESGLFDVVNAADYLT